jgi:glycosidase
MGDNIYLGDRNGVRTPMQWSSDRNAGFSRCDPARLYLPVVMDPISGYEAVNVEAQQSDPSSLLQWTRNMIALRKLFQVFGRGTLTFLNPANRKILAYLRDLDRGDGFHETVLCVANLSRFAPRWRCLATCVSRSSPWSPTRSRWRLTPSFGWNCSRPACPPNFPPNWKMKLHPKPKLRPRCPTSLEAGPSF